jgi:hypothetical protein
VTRWLKMDAAGRRRRGPPFDFNSSRVLGGAVLSLYVSEEGEAAGARLGISR